MKTLKVEISRSIGAALKQANEELARKDIPNHLKKAEWLIGNITGLDRAYIYIDRDKALSPGQVSRLKKYLSKAAKGVPVQYITKQAFFYGLEFKIENGVFIPRPETELLVEKALEIIGSSHKNPVVYDLCCGCGAVAVAIAKNSDASVFGTDISSKAIRNAVSNADAIAPSGRIRFFRGDLFEPLRRNNIYAADIIVANPPYISKKERDEVDKYVMKYEPRKALWAGDGGMEFYRRIIRDARFFLKKDGHLVCEIGYNQASKVTGIAAKNGFHHISIIKDYNGKDRVACFGM